MFSIHFITTLQKNMNKKNIIPVIIIALVGIIVAVRTNNTQKVTVENPIQVISETNNENAKEFAMDSFYEIVDGKPKPQYSLKEITVKKGDRVKIKITVTKGMHNFNIDELNIHTETPLDTTTIVEFKADKAGEFVYYCSKPNHRENGHWGKLIVTE